MSTSGAKISFTRVASVAASYSKICWGVGTIVLAASSSADVSGNPKKIVASRENAHPKVRVFSALLQLLAFILLAVEHATLLHKAAPIVVDGRFATDGFRADS